jgi:serine/threonine protein kinase
VLINFHHPNIATLLAYSFPTNLRGNYYLLYECAERGSLDKFWKDDTSREQLSWKRRNIIAYEVLTALQFLHKGNDTFQGCFHRDLKSANIVLTKNLTAQLIDCGLAKFVTDKNTRTSSTGVKGTPGYICPEYQSHGFGYTAQCDIFSFGVILTELFTGRLQNYEINASTCFNFLIQYIKKKNTRNLMDDIDSTMMVNSPKFVGAFSELALDCMSELIEDRPTGDEAIGRLALILQADSNVDEGLPDPGNSSASVLGTSLCRRCRTYPKYPNNENCPFCIMIDKQNLTIIKQDITNDMQKVTNDKQFDLEGKLDKIINKLDEILPVLTALDAKFNNPIPRLFFLYPAEKKKVWKNPKSWLNSKMVEKYHLHFVCAHSFQAINPPLKIGITKEWLVRAAPVLAVSLYLMSMALKGTANITIDVTDAAKKLFKIGKDDLQVMIKQAFAVLDERTAIDLKSNLDKNNYVNVLSSTAYDVITKLATEQNKWKENMKQVKQKTSVATLWVAKSIELNEIHGYESVV